MVRWALVALSVLAVVGCTRVIDNPQARPQAPIGPINPLQVADLLSPDVYNKDGNLFATVVPERCAGVAREVEPPFIDAHDPAAEDGGHWSADMGGVETVIEEMVAVFPSDFSATDALAAAKETVQACTGTPVTVTTMYGRTDVYEVQQAAGQAPDGALLWSLRSPSWNCDNLFVAAHNAAIEMTSCGPAGGIDVGEAAAQALERIEKLADTTA